MTQQQVQHLKPNRDNNNDKFMIDDRNERTVMLSRIPKHIPEDVIHQLVHTAIRKQQQHDGLTNSNDADDENNIDSDDHETYIEQVTLVYPTASDERNVVTELNHHKKQRSTMSSTNNDSNSSHTKNLSRFDDRPYKKKQQKVSNDHTRYQPPNTTGINVSSHSTKTEPLLLEHCGYGFVRFHKVEYAVMAITQIKCIRFDKNNLTNNNDIEPTTVENKNTLSMKKKPKYHTIYIGPCGSSTSTDNDDDNNNVKNHPNSTFAKNQICFLWTEFRCPYGTHCKFHHTGVGGSTTTTTSSKTTTTQTNHQSTDITTNRNHTTTNDDDATLAIVDRRKKIKCFNYRKGKCKLDAITCPYSHNFKVIVTTTSSTCPPCKEDENDDNHKAHDKDTTATVVIIKKRRDDSEKDCLDYINKNGHCRKLARNLPCPYQHDAIKLQQLQHKKKQQQKKRMKQEKRNSNNNIAS